MNDKFRFLIAAAACAAVLSSAPSLLAQVDDRGNPISAPEALTGEGQNWGTSTDIIYNVGADDFSVRLLGWTNAQLFNNAEIQPAANGVLDISGPVHLPSGALVTSLTVFYTDTNTAGEPSGAFIRTSTTGNLTTISNLAFPAGFSGGDNNFTVAMPAGVTIDNLTNHHAVNFTLERAATGVEGIIRVRVTYRLQVSPPPGVASFSDVPTTDGRFRFVEALVSSGLTGGCGGGNFCPDTAVTRGQLAVFLSSALGMHFPN